MTFPLFLDAPAQQSMQAVVQSIADTAVVLDQTVFYARSGGQPGDRGTLVWDGGRIAVLDTIKGEAGAIVHLVEAGAALPPAGTAITGTLDWAHRHALMRMHSALHLLCAALPGVAVTGGQIGADKSRLDFDFAGAELPDREALEARLNDLAGGHHPITTQWVEESVLDTNPTLVRTLSVKPPRGTGRLRLVRIGTEDQLVDLQPCGGTHVANTSEIGVLRIPKIENKGRQNRRIAVEFVPEA